MSQLKGASKEDTSGEKESREAASTTLIVNLLLGWTVAKPPETEMGLVNIFELRMMG